MRRCVPSTLEDGVNSELLRRNKVSTEQVLVRGQGVKRKQAQIGLLSPARIFSPNTNVEYTVRFSAVDRGALIPILARN